MNSIWKSGIYGLIIGDAMGVPVEFGTREERENNPIKDMTGYGTYNQPEGTWSDDSSMVLATLTSIKDKGRILWTDFMIGVCTENTHLLVKSLI